MSKKHDRYFLNAHTHLSFERRLLKYDHATRGTKRREVIKQLRRLWIDPSRNTWPLHVVGPTASRPQFQHLYILRIQLPLRPQQSSISRSPLFNKTPQRSFQRVIFSWFLVVMAKISLVVAVLVLFSAMAVSGQEMAPAPSPFAGAANGLLPVSNVAVCFSILFTVIAPLLFSH